MVMKQFFDTYKPCKRGHVSKRYTSNGTCVECARLASKRWREDNDNREQYNFYHQLYSGHNLNLLRKYLKDPNEIYFDHSFRKLKSLKYATPDWADTAAIRRMYEECLRLSEQMGMNFEVDHIIPLKGRNVCGLHIPENLRVVSHSLNRTKRNRFDSKKESEELMKWLKKQGL